jgi:hypothetical protein
MENRADRRRRAKAGKKSREAHATLHKVIAEFMNEVEAAIDEIPLGEKYTENCVEEDYMRIFDDFNSVLKNYHYKICEFVRMDYFPEMFRESFFEIKKEQPEMDNMEVIDLIFDSYRKSRTFKQQPYVRPKGPGTK